MEKITHPLINNQEIADDFNVELNRTKTKLIVTNNGEEIEYKIFERNEDKRISRTYPIKYIHPNNIEDEEIGVVFHVIENKEQIEYIHNNLHFSRCIFLCRFEFQYQPRKIQSINTDQDFGHAIFKEGANLSSYDIYGKRFYNCIFFKYNNFQDATFKKENKKINQSNFSCSIFFGHADFMNTKFETNSYFDNCNFVSGASFNGSEHETNISFRSAMLPKWLSLAGAKINNKLFLSNANIEKLELSNSYIGDIDSEGTKVKKADNRETFRILKGKSLQQNDNISALDFHVKEMDKHLKESTKKGECNIILFIEKYSSNFGTNPFLAMAWLFGIHFVEYLITKEYNIQLPKITIDMYKDNFIQSFNSICHIWVAFRTIITGFLIYEIIKSFHKYSRKL